MKKILKPMSLATLVAISLPAHAQKSRPPEEVSMLGTTTEILTATDAYLMSMLPLTADKATCKHVDSIARYAEIDIQRGNLMGELENLKGFAIPFCQRFEMMTARSSTLVSNLISETRMIKTESFDSAASCETMGALIQKMHGEIAAIRSDLK